MRQNQKAQSRFTDVVSQRQHAEKVFVVFLRIHFENELVFTSLTGQFSSSLYGIKLVALIS